MIIYGNYVRLNGNINKAKKVLVEQIKQTIDELAKDDSFWIVIEPDGRGPCKQDYTLGWKIAVPHMDMQEEG